MDRRPQYDYAHGRVQYDLFETDAHQLFATLDQEHLDYTAIYCVKVVYNKKVLFEQKPVDFGLQFMDGIDRPGVSKLRYWQEKVSIK